MTIDTSNEEQYVKDLTAWDQVDGYNEPFSWSGNANDPEIVRFTFVHTSNFAGRASEAGTIPGASSFDGTQAGWGREALKAWERVANIDFQENDSSFDLVIGYDNSTMMGAAAGQFAPQPYTEPNLDQGDIFILKGGAMNDLSPTASNNIGYNTLVHEIGHAIGISHPINDTGIAAPYSQDNTILSYNDSVGGQDNIIYGNLGVLTAPSTPMIFDIAVAQFLYGASSYNEGHSEYTINGDGTIETTDSVDPNDVIYGNVVTIWDSGGIDVFDASGASGNSRIDLREGFETLTVDGGGAIEFSGQYYSKIGGSLVFLAFGADIENAKGGAGNDTIIGNDLDNEITGGGGSDQLFGGIGNDSYLFYTGDTGTVTITDTSGNNRIYINGVLFDGADEIASGAGVYEATVGGIHFIIHHSDLTIEQVGGGIKLVLPGVTASDFGITLEDDTTTGAGNQSLIGDNNNQTGVNIADYLVGADGNDTILGLDLNDTLIGGGGNDSMDGGNNNDQLFGGNGNDTLLGGTGNLPAWMIANLPFLPVAHAS